MSEVAMEVLRGRVVAALPEAVERTLASYADFSLRPVEYDPKEFASHHAACKAALSHLDLLLKLTRWVAPDVTAEPCTAAGEPVSAALARARAALAAGMGDDDGAEDAL